MPEPDGEPESRAYAPQWRGTINKILYGLIFTVRLDDTTASTMAAAIVEGRLFGGGPEAYVDAIGWALAQETMLTSDLDTPHSEEQFRGFLARLGEKLDDLRPFPRAASASQ